MRIKSSIDRVRGSVGLQHFFAVNDDGLLPVDQTHRCTGLGGTDGKRNLVAVLEHLLAPSSSSENARTVHFDGPIDNFAGLILHVNKKRGMRIRIRKFRHYSG